MCLGTEGHFGEHGYPTPGPRTLADYPGTNAPFGLGRWGGHELPEGWVRAVSLFSPGSWDSLGEAQARSGAAQGLKVGVAWAFICLGS